MGTDLSVLVIVATMPAVIGPLLIDGTCRLYKARALGTAALPAWVLTQAETLKIRTTAHPRPGEPRLPRRVARSHVAHLGSPYCPGRRPLGGWPWVTEGSGAWRQQRTAPGE